MYQLHQTGCESRRRECLPGNTGVVAESLPGIDFTGTFTGTYLLWNLQLAAKMQLGVGGEGRNRSMRGPKVIQKCHILRASQALDGHYCSTGFHPFLYTVLYTGELAVWASKTNDLEAHPPLC